MVNGSAVRRDRETVRIVGIERSPNNRIDLIRKRWRVSKQVIRT